MLGFLMPALAIELFIYYVWGSSTGAGKTTAGTWSVEESFPGSPVSDFTVKVRYLKKTGHYELYVDDVHIGERAPLDGYVRSVPIIFTQLDLMEV